MHINQCKIGDSFYWCDCLWTVSGEIEKYPVDLKTEAYRECYNHTTNEFRGLHASVFWQFKQTPWSKE